MLNKLDRLTQDQDFLAEIDIDEEDTGEQVEEEEEEEEEMEEEMGDIEEEGEDELEEMDEHLGEDEALEEYLDDQDEEEEMKDQLKIPSDLADSEEDDMAEEAAKYLPNEDAEFEQFNEDQVFELAHEHKEMQFVNADMLPKIERIENQMVGDKDWQMQGEVQAGKRPMNSLLEHHLDFDVGSKLPPTMTQEKTNSIEQAIKQRVMDELFDDPVRKQLVEKTRGDDEDNRFDFTKSKKGLGELYEDDYKKKLYSADPNSFLINDLTGGADSALKQEVQSIMRSLFS